ncbi:hypothetical protein [Nocardiopsis oceani]
MNRTSTLTHRISSALADPGHEAHAVSRLNTADMAFSHLDTLLRSGAEPPDTWKVTPGDSFTTWVYVTALYDLVSEVLRTEWDSSESAEALQIAAVNWQRLTRALQEGAPLPEPWQQ